MCHIQPSTRQLEYEQMADQMRYLLTAQPGTYLYRRIHSSFPVLYAKLLTESLNVLETEIHFIAAKNNQQQ